MKRTPYLEALFPALLMCSGCLWVTSGATAAASGTAPADLRSANWQQTVQYVTDRLPACREYPDSSATVSIGRERISLYYSDQNYGTTESFPLRAAFTAEAHSSAGSWRLFVRFRDDVVTTVVPYLNGSARSDVFFCDGDRETTEGLGIALTRLHELWAGGFADGSQTGGLPEVTVRGRPGTVATLAARVNAADLDLATSSGAEALRLRIDQTARDLCHQLDLMYPDPAVSGPRGTHPNCVRDAVAGAQKRIDELVAAQRH